MSKLLVVVCRVGEFPALEEVEDDLHAMQKVVGGHLECVRLSGTPFTHGIDLWCDEEFLYKNYEPNRMIGVDLVIHGVFFIAAHDGKGATIGLNSEEQVKWMGIASAWPMAFPFLT